MKLIISNGFQHWNKKSFKIIDVLVITIGAKQARRTHCGTLILRWFRKQRLGRKCIVLSGISLEFITKSVIMSQHPIMHKLEMLNAIFFYSRFFLAQTEIPFMVSSAFGEIKQGRVSLWQLNYNKDFIELVLALLNVSVNLECDLQD